MEENILTSNIKTVNYRNFYMVNGGEMGELTRNHDWSVTALGSIPHWPKSLLTTLGILLHSRFPMFLFWGKDNICFYNDAYRPSLGNNGKHPYALGKKGEDVWPEIWADLKPMINKVLAGGGAATWSEDQLLPIYRNGCMEDVYWTFSYSPVFDDSDHPAGVFVTCTETTEKFTTLKNLTISEQRFQNLIRDATVAIIVIMGAEYVIAIVNDAFGKLVDRNTKDLLGKPFFDIITETKPFSHEIIGNVLTTGESLSLYDQPYFVYVEGRKKEGFANLDYQPYRESSGLISGVIIQCQDITEQVVARKTAKKLIEDSEANLRNIILQSPVAMCIFKGPEHVLEIANERMLELWGKPGTELLHKPIFEGLPEAKNYGYKQVLENVYTTGETYKAYGVPVSLNRKETTELIFISYVAEAYREPDGIISGIMAVASDVTAQVRAKKRIEMAEERARLAIQSADLGVYEVYLTNNQLVADDRFVEIYGLNKDASYTDILSTIHPDDLELRRQAVATAMNTGTLYYQARSILPDGSIHWVRIMGKVQYNAQKEAIKIIGVAQDITEQKRFAEELEKKVNERTRELAEANLQLQQSNTELNQFAFIASHDLQEPLRKVKTFTGLLLSGLSDASDKTKEYIRKITNSTERMQTLIYDVLKFSQLSKERGKFVAVDLNDIIMQMLGDFELAIEQKSATVTIGSMPVIEAIPLQMTQLFSNLISNALKFKSEERQLEIHISAKKLPMQGIQKFKKLKAGKSYYFIEVSDNGIGFSQEYAKQIFVIFQRLHTRTKYEGTGIGLALCKKITFNHHGIIYANATLNTGASFVIILPQVQEASERWQPENL